MSQYYFDANHLIPREIVVNTLPVDASLLARALTELAGRRVRIRSTVREARARWLKLATQSAESNLASHLVGRQTTLHRFESLQALLELPELPERVECFDVSHSAGEATVASCVVFDHQGPRKADYRRFNITEVTPGDDFAAMHQALLRRFRRAQAGEGAVPDVLLIDGGRGQTAQAMAVLGELQIAGVADGNWTLIILGLVISIPMIIAGSAIILALIDKFPVIVWAGAALLGFVAGEMLISDVAVVSRFGEEFAHSWELALGLFFAAAVVVVGWLIVKARKAKHVEEGAH